MNAERHLTPEERAAYRQQTLAPAALIAASDHLAQCECCRADLQRAQPARAASFEELAAAASGELDPLAQRPFAGSEELADLVRFREEMNALPPHDYSLGDASGARTSWILPIAAGLALGLAFLWWNSSTRHQPGGLVLHDRGEQVVVRQNGEIPALGPLPAELQAEVRTATATGKAPLPPLLAQLRPATGTLAGALAAASGFTELAPVGTVVASAQPTLRWTLLPGATGYRVNLLRRSGSDIITSPLLGANTDSWTPQPLQPGEVYEWEVEALRDDELIAKAPAPPAPEARFAVLPNEKAQELQRLRRQLHGSHFLLGLAYARAGLLPEARVEFEALARENPQSPLPQNLLSSLSAR